MRTLTLLLVPVLTGVALFSIYQVRQELKISYNKGYESGVMHGEAQVRANCDFDHGKRFTCHYNEYMNISGQCRTLKAIQEGGNCNGYLCTDMPVPPYPYRDTEKH